MSLINDALRRAKHSQQSKTPPEVSHALRPVEATAVPQRNSSNLLLPLLIVVLLVAGGLFIGLALSQRDGGATVTVNAKQPSPGVVAQPAQPVAPAPEPAPQPAVVAAAPVPPPAPAQPAAVATSDVATAAPAVTEVAPVQPAEVVPAKPAVPVVRGIFFNPTRPSAVLNSKTVFVGESVTGFRVVAITRDSVTVVNDGVTNVLTLAE